MGQGGVTKDVEAEKGYVLAFLFSTSNLHLYVRIPDE